MGKHYSEPAGVFEVAGPDLDELWQPDRQLRGRFQRREVDLVANLNRLAVYVHQNRWFVLDFSGA